MGTLNNYGGSTRYHFDRTPGIERQGNPLEIYMKEDKEDKKRKSLIMHPGTIATGLVGGALAGANRKAAKDFDAIMAKRKEAEALSKVLKNKSNATSYAGQVSDFLDSIDVALMPNGVMFHLETKDGNIPLDFTPKAKLHEADLVALQHGDKAYFKRALLNQINMDLANVENEVAKKVVGNHIKYVNALRVADDNPFLLDEPDNSPVELSSKLASIKAIYGDNKMEKVASELLDSVEYALGDDIEVDLSLRANPQRALLGDTTLRRVNPLVFNDLIKSENFFDHGVARELFEPIYTRDAVVYTLNDDIVHVFHVDDMSDRDYESFRLEDSDYFREKMEELLRVGFVKEAEIDHRLMDLPMEKTAAEEHLHIKDIFKKSGVHPVVYFIALTSKMGEEWMDLESGALMIAIEKMFDLGDDGIEDIPLNKILSIKAANKGDTVYTSHHAFEKVIRSFNSKPIDFLEREDDLTLVDLVHGLNVLNRITPYDNVYDNFSPDIYSYIVQVLTHEERYMWGVNLSETEEESQFIGIVNLSLHDSLNKHFLSKAKDDDEALEAVKKNKATFEACLEIVDEIRAEFDNYSNIGEEVRKRALARGLDERIANIVTIEVVANLAMDIYLNEQDELLAKQLSDLGFVEKVGTI